MNRQPSQSVVDAAHVAPVSSPKSAEPPAVAESVAGPAVANLQETARWERVLRERFGFSEFLPGQRRAIELLMQGQSVAAVFPTGGGKSLCYQLPALLLPGVTLVVSPLIALMKDQIDALASRGIPAVRLDSSLTLSEYQAAVQKLRQGALRLVYVAPERFQNERFRALLQPLQVSLFAVDEAHCISEWGHNFRPDYLKLASFAGQCGAERLLALTATAPPRVLGDICREFGIGADAAVVTGFYRPNLTLRTTPCQASERRRLLRDRLQQQAPAATIVYVTLQRTAEEVAHDLKQAGIEARAYHAGMDAEERKEVQEWFLASGQAIIVATIAFGMGIDKPDIRYIYHYNLPKSLENYSQEIGRAGRDGHPSVCETFVCANDRRVLENFAYGDTPDPVRVQSLVQELFSLGEEFSLSLYDLAFRHDLRELVLRTLLTYLELDGYLTSGTPVYGEYRFKPHIGSAELLSHFEGERRQFLADLLSTARRAATWCHLEVDRAIQKLKTDRGRIVRALDYLAERGWLELQASKVQHRYRRVRQPEDRGALAAELFDRCLQRQEQELVRLQQVVQLMELDGCQTNALAAHFGEQRTAACGHCNWCQTRQQPVDIPPPDYPLIDPHIWQRACQLRQRHPQVLAADRAFARFLCGIRSPQLTRAKLVADPLFGTLQQVPFDEVLAQAESAGPKKA